MAQLQDHESEKQGGSDREQKHSHLDRQRESFSESPTERGGTPEDLLRSSD
jgi:hypothetical protein